MGVAPEEHCGECSSSGSGGSQLRVLRHLKMALPFPHLPGPHFAPRQNADTIPIIRYNLQSGVDGFNAMMLAREERLLSIAPGNYLGVPFTPLAPNPETGDSHHIVRISNEWGPEGVEVDFLFRDQNLYFTGFRRVENDVGGQLYSFSGGEVPAFLQPVEIGLGSRHEAKYVTTIGNIYSWTDMWETFANYEGEEPNDQLRRAKARGIVTLAEALRFWRVRREVAQRMEIQPLVAFPLTELMWHTMQSWRVLCDFLVDAMRRLALPENDPNRQPDQVQLARYADPYQINNLDDLIGPNGDIRVIYGRPELMIAPDVLQQLKNLPGASDVEEPGFPSDDEDE